MEPDMVSYLLPTKLRMSRFFAGVTSY